MKPTFIDAKTAIRSLPAKGPIHCFAGFLGADWNKQSVVQEIKEAKKIAWTDHLMNHNLAIEAGPRSV